MVQLLGGHKIRVHGCIYGLPFYTLAIQTQDKALALCPASGERESETPPASTAESRRAQLPPPQPPCFPKRDKFITQNLSKPRYTPPPPPPPLRTAPLADFLPKSGNYLFFMLLCGECCCYILLLYCSSYAVATSFNDQNIAHGKFGPP